MPEGQTGTPGRKSERDGLQAGCSRICDPQRESCFLEPAVVRRAVPKSQECNLEPDNSEFAVGRASNRKKEKRKERVAEARKLRISCNRRSGTVGPRGNRTASRTLVPECARKWQIPRVDHG